MGLLYLVYVLFKLVFLHWFLGTVSLCLSRLRVGFPVFLDIIPIDFQNLVFWGFISLDRLWRI